MGLSSLLVMCRFTNSRAFCCDICPIPINGMNYNNIAIRRFMVNQKCNNKSRGINQFISMKTWANIKLVELNSKYLDNAQ